MKKTVDIKKCPICGCGQISICQSVVHHFFCEACRACFDWDVGTAHVLTDKDKERQFFYATGFKKEDAEKEYKECWG